MIDQLFPPTLTSAHSPTYYVMSYVLQFASSVRGAISSKKISLHGSEKFQTHTHKEFSRRSIPPLECRAVDPSKLVVESNELADESKPEVEEEAAQADAAMQQAARVDQHCIL